MRIILRILFRIRYDSKKSCTADWPKIYGNQLPYGEKPSSSHGEAIDESVVHHFEFGGQ
jgi:hypothetical protein